MGCTDNKNYSELPNLSFNRPIWECYFFMKWQNGFWRSVSEPKLGTKTEHFQMLNCPNVNHMWSTESKGVIYNINSSAPCCELNCSLMLSLETPRGLRPSFSDPSAAGETLQQACHHAHWHQSVLRVAVWHNTAGVALCPGGKSGSIAVAALALITHTHTNSLQLTVGWCWQRDRGLHLIVSQCGGGDARR